MTITPAEDPTLIQVVDRFRARVDADPLRYQRWTVPQQAYEDSEARITLLRTGNQFGKTWAGCRKVIHRCLGIHPEKRVHPPPIEAWVICHSWSQSIAVQQKLWYLLPKALVTPDTRWSPKNGFSGVQKAVQFRNGSILRIKTIGQDTLDLASATIHYVWIDEPLADAETFSELQMRLRRTAGDIGITMTPATTGDITYLREMADGGKLADLHYRMEPENFLPIGARYPLLDEGGTPMGAAWVEDQIERTLGWARPVRCHGDWEYGRIDSIFENFHPEDHVVPNLAGSDVAPDGEVVLSVGVDYGEERLRTAANLIAVDDSDPDEPRVFVLAEYAPTQASKTKQDARSILQMVAAQGFAWTDLRYAYGDKRLMDAKGRITKKSNRQMTAEIEKALGIRAGVRPRFENVKRGIGKGRGAVWRGIHWINGRMLTPGAFFIDASCTRTIECVQKWQGGEREEWKDQLDAVRYALRPWIFRTRRRSARPVRFG